MDNKRIESLRKAASIASKKSRSGESCLRHSNCSPNFRIKHENNVEKGEKILREKILGNV